MKLNMFDFDVSQEFDGTYNCLALFGILNHDNLYRFAYNLNIQQGIKINIVTEDTIINGIKLIDILNNDIGYKKLISLTNEKCVLCDYIRLFLIYEYNFNNFIDLDIVVDKNNPITSIQDTNYNTSHILMNNITTHYQYAKLKK